MTQSTATNTKYNQQQGFTLVELMIALSIFAVLSMLGWQVVNQLAKTNERLSLQQKDLQQLQYAHIQIQNDIQQLVQRSIKKPRKSNELVIQEQQTDNVTIDEVMFSFSRVASFDPRTVLSDQKAIMQKGVLTRITYNVADNALVRSSEHTHKLVDADNGDGTQTSVLIQDVTDFSVAPVFAKQTLIANTGEEPQTQKNTASPAQGVIISFTYKGMPIEWRFSFVGQLSAKMNKRVSKTAGQQNQSTNNQPTNNQGSANNNSNNSSTSNNATNANGSNTTSK